MSKHPRYFSSDDTTLERKVLHRADQLEMRYRELQELREQVREIEQQSAVGPDDRNQPVIGH